MRNIIIIMITFAAFANVTYGKSISENESSSNEIIEPIPANFSSEKSVSIRLVDVEVIDGGLVLNFRVINGLDKAIYSTTSGLSNPHCHIQVLKNRKWKDVELWSCGLGIRRSEVPPRSTFCFQKQPQLNTEGFRYGFAYSFSSEPSSHKDSDITWTNKLRVADSRESIIEGLLYQRISVDWKDVSLVRAINILKSNLSSVANDGLIVPIDLDSSLTQKTLDQAFSLKLEYVSVLEVLYCIRDLTPATFRFDEYYVTILEDK